MAEGDRKFRQPIFAQWKLMGQIPCAMAWH
ncbi:hypothetical protein N789_03925 [Arenimonas oryziterrae DSM 21050 = YC6267]|uniref:Uncharacterized protein n=1 Tax=Arenimonas oryziterrae DSM 21050 = YC6267 TaxID=1121015 RepID=A0A091B9C2_9GAMM|nr:hypothetical protein N789_03925 [Arenimonas oryziterrae DSM 21050 = YC6267]